MNFNPLAEKLREKSLLSGDPWKLLAHTWLIADEKTKIGEKVHHPWVCLNERHPDQGVNYNVCLCSTKKPESASEKMVHWTPSWNFFKTRSGGVYKNMRRKVLS